MMNCFSRSVKSIRLATQLLATTSTRNHQSSVSTSRLTPLSMLHPKEGGEEEERTELLERKRRLVLAGMADEDTRRRAETVFRAAARKFAGPASSADALRLPAMPAEVFRGLARRLLGLALSKTELGALVLDLYGLAAIERGEVPAEDLLRRFLAAGQEERLRERAEQQRREEARVRAEAEASRRREQLAGSAGSSPSLPFTEADEARAMEKLAVAGAQLDRRGLANDPAAEAFQDAPLTPASLAEGLRLVLGVSLSRKEVCAAFVRLSGESGDGRLTGHQLVRRVLRLGEARRAELRAAETRRRELEMMEQARLRDKYEAIEPGSGARFSASDLDAARRRLREAALRFHGDRRARLSELYASSLRPSELRHLLRAELALDLSAAEAAALGSLFVEGDEARDGRLPEAARVNGSAFVAHFLRLVAEARSEQRSARRRRARERRAEQLADAEQRERRELARSVDLDFDESFRTRTLQRLSLFAGRFDRSSPAAVSLEPFEGIDMTPAVLQQTLYRLVGLRLSRKELGVLVSEFADKETQLVRSRDFLQAFVRAGFEQREVWRRARAAKVKRSEEAAKEAQLRRQLEQTALRAAAANMSFSQSDRDSALEKLGRACLGSDRLDSGASGLGAFESGVMDAAALRDNLRKVFNVYLSPKELGAVMAELDPKNEGFIRARDLLRFLLKMSAGRKAALRKPSPKRRTSADHIFKAEDSPSSEEEVVDWRFEPEHLDSAIAKFEAAMLAADPRALQVFSGTRMRAAELRGLFQRTLKVSLSPPELGALMNKMGVALSDGAPPAAAAVDTLVLKSYLIRLRHLAQAKRQQQLNEERRRRKEESAARAARAELLEAQRTRLDEDYQYSEADKDSALRKLAEASLRYDKSSPTGASLECFQRAFLTASEFREAMKLNFNLLLSNKELSAVVETFEYRSSGSLDCSAFTNAFVKASRRNATPSDAKLCVVDGNRRAVEAAADPARGAAAEGVTQEDLPREEDGAAGGRERAYP